MRKQQIIGQREQRHNENVYSEKITKTNNKNKINENKQKGD